MPTDANQPFAKSLLSRCQPLLVHALCSIPEGHPDYVEAKALLAEIAPLINPEVHLAFQAVGAGPRIYTREQILAAVDACTEIDSMDVEESCGANTGIGLLLDRLGILRDAAPATLPAAPLQRFRFSFLFHPATEWSKPYRCEEVFEGVDQTAAEQAFQCNWYRNVTDVKCEQID